MAEDGAPAVVTDLALAFDNASKSGSVTFKAPSKTFAGNPLTGNLTYRIKADGNEVGIGRIEAGKTVTANVTVPSTGDVLFTVTTENAIGVSPEVKQKAWIGYDIPASPVVTLKIGADNKATVSWTAPEGLHAGYLGALKYDVVRYPDSVKIANQTTATTISDQLSVGQLKAYSYGVTAFTNETKGETGMSNYVAIGNPIEVPYLEDFSDEGSFALYTVIDANNDGKTWEWFEGAAGTNANKEKAADDWLITPAVHLAPGYLYSVSLKARSTFATFPERFEVKYGKGNTIADMTTELVPEEQISTPKYKTYGKEIVVTDDGNYNFGIHCVSEANMYSLLIDSINIVKKASLAAPDSVTNLVLTPGDMGKMEATIAFRTPTQTIAGNSLSSLTKIEILRNGQLIHTFNAPATGTQLSYKDEGVTLNGINKYTVIPYNTESAGLQYETSAFVGEDVPAKPMARLIDGQTKITIEWLASSIGKNGGYVNADKLKYTIYAIDNSGYNELIAENISGTSYDVPFNTDEGDQRLIQYTIQAEGVGGKSGFVGTEGIVVGAPFTLPFHEGVPGGKMTMPLWWIESMDDMNPFRMFYGMSSDEDNGCFVWYSMKENEWTSMNTGKIKTAGGGSNLSLAYDYYALPGRNVSLAIKAQKADGTEDVLREIDFRKLTGGEAWATDIVPLAQYAAERYVILKFKYTSNEKRLQLYLDNISVLNLDNNNLKVAVDAPEKATSGTTADFKVRVENTGKAVTNGYRLTVTVDGKTFKEENNESLAPMKHRDVRMTIPIGAAEQGKKVVSVGIDYTDDYADDNVAVANINVEPSKLPQPRAFEAKAEDGNIVRMTWQAPMETTETGTEDFEAYAPWIMENIGDWTVIDGDKLETYNVFQNTSWPHINEPQAFLVYNLANLGYDVTQINPDHVPHSGNQCLISVNGNGVNDNWLISPLLSGKAQKIKFYASSMNPNYPETFEIMYSATGKNTEDFKKIADFPDAEGGWNEYSAELPEGAKYFAIRLISNNRLALLVDDITFEGAAINPTGYNIYRDGNLLKTMNAEARAAEDHTDRNHTYGLTALYAKGESVPVTSNVTAITTIETANGRHYTVYTLDGKHVGTRLNSLNSLPSGVYIVNGKKITVK
ncbi:choice-of-anchor J domain-containing protein [Prevotella falsenii]|uniref:choice-of-anchor J domain-containing protein n=1 Tax=Prevotella falsenii TaxID=515414 RepID=UPI0018DE6B5B|nr:choice-of-anchor J domain-containing protein [Prevotella falsenii]